MAPRGLYTAGTLRAITWTAIAVGMIILAAVLLRRLGASLVVELDDERQNATAPLEPFRAELPGGFDPIPEFDTNRAEVAESPSSRNRSGRWTCSRKRSPHLDYCVQT